MTARKARRYAWHICIPDLTPQPDPGPTSKCQHTPQPRGYLARSEWAESMLKTHKQERCPHCGLWAIWTPKPPRATRRAVARVLVGLADV